MRAVLWGGCISAALISLLLLLLSGVVTGGIMPTHTLYLGPSNASEKNTEAYKLIVSQASAINVTVLLPFDSRYKASVRRVGPAIQMGFDKVKELGLLPNHKVRLSYIDSNCSNMIAPLRAVEYKLKNAVHVFFGPSCELALAPVARFLQFWNTPLLTAGALTADYALPKTTPESEYFLTTRTGIGFTEMVNFLLKFFHKLHWKKVMLMYEKDGMEEVSGLQTCRFFMTSMVEYLKGFSFNTFDLDTNNVNASIKDNLQSHLGLKYSGECPLCWGNAFSLPY